MHDAINHNSVGEIRAVLASRGIALKKRFGQNFLIDPGRRSRIADAILATVPGTTSGLRAVGEIWEVGPGLGSLTDELLTRRVTPRLFELDHGLVALLSQRYGESVPIVSGDALRTIPETASRIGVPTVICGNLPYYSASAIIAMILERLDPAPTQLFLVQRELAQRLGASVGDGRSYSALSVLVGLRSRVETLFSVPGTAFFPRPEVDSTVVRLTPLFDGPTTSETEIASRIARTVFAQRRKALRNSLGAYRDAAVAAGIDTADRPENLTPDAYLAVARAYLRAR